MDLNLYTTNAYISAGEIAVIENISDDFASMTIDFGEGEIQYFNPPLSSYEISYEVQGTKTIAVTATTSTDILSAKEFPNFFNVTTFDNYDPDIIRIFETTKLELPWGCPLTPPNEWVTENNINTIFYKFFDNMDYLKTISKIYDRPPTKYIGWRQQLAPTLDAAIPQNWNSYDPVSGYTVGIPGYSAKVEIADIKEYDNLLWLATSDILVPYGPRRPIILAQTKDYTSTIVLSADQKSQDDYFGTIAAIDFDENGNLFVLDSKFKEVSVFNYNDGALTYLFKWGGAQSFLPKSKFVDVTDIYVDDSPTKHKNTILITDTGNACVKRFSNTGIWISTITHPEITGKTIQVGGPISAITDSKGRIHILTYNKVYVFDLNNAFLFSYDVPSPPSPEYHKLPKKIVNNYNQNGFMYIVFDNFLSKITENGIFAGNFAAGFKTVNSFFVNGVEVFSHPYFLSATQDEHYNLYIATKDGYIIKFVDLVKVISIREDTSALEWPLSAVLIDKDEYIQDWVYNKSFAKIWDNLEIIRRSIFDKFESFEIQPGVNVLFTNTFTLSDVLYSQYTKEDIIIGINEFVAADVLNRVITKLCANQQDILLMQADRPVIASPEVYEFCWAVEAVKCSGRNPRTFIETTCPGGTFPTKWFEAKSKCCI